MSSAPNERFISEEIKALTSSADTRAMGQGEPGLPQEFLWGTEPLVITKVLRTWREKGPCTHGSRESYLRKHWYEVALATGERAKIYFERKPFAKARKPRWWLYSLGPAAD